MIYFYDTCALLSKQASAFNNKFFISNITLKELEGIKTSGTKDEQTRYNARKIIHLLSENSDKYEIIDWLSTWDADIKEYVQLSDNNDSKIIYSAYLTSKDNEDLVFCTEDLCCLELARSFGLVVEYLDNKIDDYEGFIELQFSTDEELAEFYNDLSIPCQKYNLLENEYVIIRDKAHSIIDKYVVKCGVLEPVAFVSFESKMFGKVKPKDAFQAVAMDSIKNNDITLLGGPAGSGKSYLAMAYLFSALERGVIDRIIIICNPVATRGAAKLGFYPGDKNTKLLDCQIGNFLISKLGGDRAIVEDMISRGQIILLPLADARGYDTSGMHAGIYMTESQNTDIDLMKLILQRVGDDSKVIIEGDYGTQVDAAMYGGSNNGMKRASEVFRGHDCFGQVNLQTIWRSKIAAIAEDM